MKGMKNMKEWKEEKEKWKNWKNEKWKKCTARDDTSSSSAAALREGTPHSYPQLRGYGICIWELTERTGLAPSRIGKPRKSSSRKSCENSQEVAEFEKICFTEAERTEQLRVDDLSRQKFHERQPTVNQLTVQTQELQDSVNSLSGTIEAKR